MFREIEINTGQSYSRICFGFDWRQVTKLLPADARVVILTDHNLRRLYGHEFPDFPVLAVEPGESTKSLATIGRLTERLLKLGIDRNGFILGIGGGVVCDLTGFLASIYMRGIRFGFVSTSLLSQVDASIGGKNGVNSKSAKNIIGVFNQPEFVICDHSMLMTLPDEEFLSGLSEVLKVAFIRDRELISILEVNYKAILARDGNLLGDIIFKSVEIKKSVVQEDERESGIRKILNFGHTFGHAAESVYGIKHGIAVAWGMLAAMELSYQRGYLTKSDKHILTDLINKLNLVQGTNINGAEIAHKISYDKKRSGEFIDFVFLTAPGFYKLEKEPLSELVNFIQDFK